MPAGEDTMFSRHHSAYEPRVATLADSEAVHRLIARAWRVYLRFPPEELLARLRPGLGWVAGRRAEISGFLLVEMQPFLFALITGAAVSDEWRVSAYLDTFLPLIEAAVRPQGAGALAQIGYAPWLAPVLRERGFVSRDWVVTYEWLYQPMAVRGNQSVTLRSAHLRDLPTLLALDNQIFGPLWHKPATSFEEALAQAFLFTVAEKDGQIIGYQWCEKHDAHAHLTRLAVRPGWEGQGVGTRLLTEALVAVIKAGTHWVTLNTQESNLRSQMLYERHGFRRTDERVPVLWKDL
jgi:ribosomal-protein-alanine N-acetyltransferase